MIRHIGAGCVLLGASLLSACGGGGGDDDDGTVFYKVDQATCPAGTATYNFTIDNAIVGIETLAAGATSKGYAASAGNHFIGASKAGFAWPALSYQVPAGGSFTLTLVCT